MNKKLMLAAALAATTFTAGLAGNVASASQAPAPKPPVVQEQDVHQQKPQKQDKEHNKIKNDKQHKPAKDKQPAPKQDKKPLPAPVR